MSDEHSTDDELAEALTLLAHDLKNPLAAVLTNLGFVRGVVDELDPESRPDPAALDDVREAMFDVRLACESLQRFVSNLEVLARDLGVARPPPSGESPPIDLLSIADEIANRQRETADARRITIRVDAATDAWARGDRDALVRAADNVLADALQHAPAGSVVRIEVARSDAEATLTVLDRGAVVPPELRIEAASRAGQTRAKGRPEARYGRGLALYVAAVAARAGGGRLELADRDGESAMTLVFPRFEETG